MKKYLVYKQETMSRSRWMTTASGYLRIKQNGLFQGEINDEDLDRITSFIVNVYVPMFVRIHLKPKAFDGPSNMLYARDRLLDFALIDTDMAHHIRPYLEKHAITWLSPKNVAISCYADNPPFDCNSIKNIRTLSVDVKDLLWRKRPLSRSSLLSRSVLPVAQQVPQHFGKQLKTIIVHVSGLLDTSKKSSRPTKFKTT